MDLTKKQQLTDRQTSHMILSVSSLNFLNKINLARSFVKTFSRVFFNWWLSKRKFEMDTRSKFKHVNIFSTMCGYAGFRIEFMIVSQFKITYLYCYANLIWKLKLIFQVNFIWKHLLMLICWIRNIETKHNKNCCFY